MTFDKTATPPLGYVDMMPCEVVMPGGQIIRRARVVVHEQRIVVTAENPSEPSDTYVPYDGEVLVVHEWPDPYAPVRQMRAVVTTGVGQIVVNRIPGCGCGSSGLSSVDVTGFYPVKATTRRRGA